MDVIDRKPATGPATFVGDQVNRHGSDFNGSEMVNQQRDLASEENPRSCNRGDC